MNKKNFTKCQKNFTCVGTSKKKKKKKKTEKKKFNKNKKKKKKKKKKKIHQRTETYKK